MQASGLANGGGQKVFAQGNELRHDDEEDGAQKRAVHRTQTTDHHHQQQVDRLDDGKLLGRQEHDLVRIERPTYAGERGRERKRQGFVARQVNAHALRRDLGIADGHKRSAGGRTQQIQYAQGGHHTHHQAEEIELAGGVQLPAKQIGVAHHQAFVATGHAFPAGDALFHNKAKGQRGHAEVNALDPQRRQAHHHTDHRRQGTGGQQSQREGHTGVDHYRLGVGAHPQKRRVAQREQTGEAGQQHQPQAHNRVNQHKGELRQPVLVHQPGRCEQEQAQQAVPEHMAAVFGQPDVLVVIGLEQESHTFFRSCSPNRPLGLSTSMSSTTM